MGIFRLAGLNKGDEYAMEEMYNLNIIIFWKLQTFRFLLGNFARQKTLPDVRCEPVVEINRNHH